ncbi:MAG: GGDEF domain-containing protein [Treponema sp.]|nr:GGDEF domain-containing protein [Treponema sp.]
MTNEIKFKKTISFTIFSLGTLVNTVGFFAAAGITKAITGIFWVVDLSAFLIFCLWKKKYDAYIKIFMLLFGMMLFPSILYTSTLPKQAILYDFILPSIYAVSIRKKRDLILPLLNGVLISAIAYCRLNLWYAVIFLFVYSFCILLTSMFSMTLFNNFEELERAYNIIADVAKKDRLTGILNRFGLENALKNKKDLPCYAIMIDIDFFKQVNDTYGHEIGDEVLYKLGTILKKHSSKDFIVSRRGGEEFLLYSFKDYEQTLDMLMSIYTDIENIIVINDFHVHISSGISILGTASEELIEDADRNLYLSKNSGRNRISANMENVPIILKK